MINSMVSAPEVTARSTIRTPDPFKPAVLIRDGKVFAKGFMAIYVFITQKNDSAQKNQNVVRK